MRVRNKIDRFNLVIDAVNNLNLGIIGDDIVRDMKEKLALHEHYIVENGIDIEEVRNWMFKD